MKEEDIDWGEETKPYWYCEGCGYDDHKKPMPKDRDKFYSQPRNIKCPKCKTEGFSPVGF